MLVHHGLEFGDGRLRERCVGQRADLTQRECRHLGDLIGVGEQIHERTLGGHRVSQTRRELCGASPNERVGVGDELTPLVDFERLHPEERTHGGRSNSGIFGSDDALNEVEVAPMASLDDVARFNDSSRGVVERHRIWNARALQRCGCAEVDNVEGNNMAHMVIYRGADGSPGYHQTDEVHDAVAYVEQLRNDEGVQEAKIFRMEEVTFEYRPYFRVELTSSERTLAAPAAKPAVAAAPAVEVKAPEAAAPAAEPVTDLTDAAEAAETAAPAAGSVPSAESNGDVGARRGLFGR